MEALLQKRRAQKARVLLLFGLLENQLDQLYLFGGRTLSLRGRNTISFRLHTYYRYNKYVPVVLLIGTAGLVLVSRKTSYRLTIFFLTLLVTYSKIAYTLYIGYNITSYISSSSSSSSPP
jgi:hypothetical protein